MNTCLRIAGAILITTPGWHAEAAWLCFPLGLVLLLRSIADLHWKGATPTEIERTEDPTGACSHESIAKKRAQINDWIKSL